MAVIFSKGDKLEEGHYTVIKEIGVGGMGVVYHCRDEQLMRDVAIKMLLPELMADKSSVEIFRQEARLAAQLEHPNIVTVYDIGVEERQKRSHHFVSMEYLPGGNLANRVISGPLAVEHCLNWMKQLASGLTFAHKRSVVHQDVKADNIFITTEGDLKIGDFGLARLLVGRVNYSSAVKGMGTPAYMSPELCRGEPQDHRSDIYSLGVLFFEMATGQLPFRAKGMIEMATKHTSAPIPSVKRINPLIPENLDKVIRRMMAKTPEERYQNMAEVLTILDELIFELRVARLGLVHRPMLRSGPVPVEQLTPQAVESVATKPLTETPQPVGASPNAKSSLREPDYGASTLPQSLPRAAGDALIAELERSSQERAELARQIPVQVPVKPSVKIDAPGRVSRTRMKALATAPVKSPLKAPIKPLWSFKSKGPFGWSSSPVLDKEESLLFCASTDGSLYAIDAKSGQEVWQHKTGAPILSTPVLHGDKVAIGNTAGGVFSFAAKTGALVWNTAVDEEILTTPVGYKDSLLVPTAKGRLLCMNQKTGALLWQFKANHAIVSAPHTHTNLILFGTKGGSFHSVAADTGKPVWNFSASGSIVASPAVSVDSVYFGTEDGVFYALEAESGGMFWEYSTNKPIVSRGVIAFTSVIFCSHDKWLYCCEKYDGSLKWKSSVRGKTIANLIAVRDLVLTVTIDGWLQAFATSNGELRWQKSFDRGLESAPLVVNDKLFIGTVEGDIMAFELEQ